MSDVREFAIGNTGRSVKAYPSKTFGAGGVTGGGLSGQVVTVGSEDRWVSIWARDVNAMLEALLEAKAYLAELDGNPAAPGEGSA